MIVKLLGRLDRDRQLVAVFVGDVRVPSRIGLAFRDLFAPEPQREQQLARLGDG